MGEFVSLAQVLESIVFVIGHRAWGIGHGAWGKEGIGHGVKRALGAGSQKPGFLGEYFVMACRLGTKPGF